MTMKEKSLPPIPSGWIAKRDALAGFAAVTSRTMAARHESVRDSAQEFHKPDAQFSVSKNQLIPQIGTVAATTAATGKPDARLRFKAAGREYRISRSLI